MFITAKQKPQQLLQQIPGILANKRCGGGRLIMDIVYNGRHMAVKKKKK